ncbi:hypothetical protein LR48_Vigan11g051900 [Vigna angularis]|uniref:Uncharacterized protein n=1 Tax=Phaseolus angularis TaxID=3914 RepID=A0A0L9VR04_PHAAN|nr:hypothetical protein LR48_Vigan11g051900 [Vigna angularis]
MKEDIRKEMMEEITKKVRAKLYDEVAEMVTRQFQQRYEDYGNRPPPSVLAEHVVPPTGRSGKGSCSTAGALGDDMDDTRPCQLYILSDTETMLVAHGTVYETATVVHGVQLAEDEEIGQEGSPTPKKTHLSEDNPLSALDELAKLISDASMNVHWDSTTVGREVQIPLYLHHQDVRELASEREEINITLIHLWIMYMFDVSTKKEFNDICGFIDPSMTHMKEINLMIPKHTSPPALEWGRRYIFSLIYLATCDLHTGEHYCLVLFIA